MFSVRRVAWGFLEVFTVGITAGFITTIALAGFPGLEFGTRLAFLLIPLVLGLSFQDFVLGKARLPLASLGKPRITLRWLLSPLPRWLRIVGLLLAIVALARPQLTKRETIVESNGLDILLAMDTSCSMREEDMATSTGYTSRLEAAKYVAGEFVRSRPHDRIGVVVFGEEAFTHVPLTLDHQTLEDVLSQTAIGIAGRGTAIGQAIAVSAKRLKELEAPERLIVLMTDGRNTAGSIDPLAAAKVAAALNIRIYTIGIGANSGSIFGIRTSDGIDEATLTAIAEKTKGAYFRASDVASLREVYASIDQLQPSPAKVKDLVERQELFYRVLIPGLFLLSMGFLLSQIGLRRSP